MGLAEHLREGATLLRQKIPFTGFGDGSVYFGAAYILLGIEVDRPCRIRFYDDNVGRNTISERLRPFGEGLRTDNVSLIADIRATSAGIYTMDPVLYGVPDNTSTYFTFFNITESGGQTVNGNVLVYKLEDENIQALPGNDFYTTSNRRSIPFAVGSGEIDFPRTCLLLNAISTGGAGRLRLYARADSLSNEDERLRSFDTALEDSNIILIQDVKLTNNVRVRFSPKIVSTNLHGLQPSLESIRNNRVAVKSLSKIYYRFESSNPVTTATLNIFSLEE